MSAWLPKLGFSYPQVAIVDGFASAGRYRDGRRGSPLIMLDAYLGRSAGDRARFKHPPDFTFIESKRSFAQHLRDEIDAIGDLKGARVEVIHGRERLENRRYTPAIKRYFRRLESLVETGDAPGADTTHRELVSTIDKAVKRGAMHKNTGARKKSRAARTVAGTSQQ